MKRKTRKHRQKARSKVTPQPQLEPKPQPTIELPGAGTLGLLVDISEKLIKDKDDMVIQVLRLEDIVSLLKKRSEESRISQVDPNYLIYQMR